MNLNYHWNIPIHYTILSPLLSTTSPPIHTAPSRLPSPPNPPESKTGEVRRRSASRHPLFYMDIRFRADVSLRSKFLDGDFSLFSQFFNKGTTK